MLTPSSSSIAPRLVVLLVLTGCDFADATPRLTASTATSPVVTTGHRAPHRIEARPRSWTQPGTLQPLYARIAADLRAGKPLVITSYMGMWYGQTTKKCLYWDWYGYGVKPLFRRVKQAKVMRVKGRIFQPGKLWRWYRWKEALSVDTTGPTAGLLEEVAVFRQRVRPNRRWRKLGVRAPFDVVLVFKLYEGSERGMHAAITALRRDLPQRHAQPLVLADGTTVDLSQAQVRGYIGHNVFYGLSDVEAARELPPVVGRVTRKTGVFAVTCKGARYGFVQALAQDNVLAVALTTSKMSSEAYNIMGIADGLARAMPAKPLARHCDRSYRSFQPRAGHLYVNHGAGLFPEK